MKTITENKTDRITKLREYYINNSPMSVNRDFVMWKCHRSKMLFIEGWLGATEAPTTKLRYSMAEAYMLKNTRPIIEKGELLVGQPDLSPFSKEEQEKYDKYMIFEDYVPKQRGRGSHFGLDYSLLFQKGINGILEDLKEKLENIDINDGTQVEKYEFYSCMKIELEGLKTLCENYADYAEELAKKAIGQEKQELTALAETLKQVPANPARTFKEALQSLHMFTWSLYGLYSYGKPDVYLLPFYQNDIKNGILTEDEAQELVDCFFLLNIPNVSGWAAQSMVLAGRDRSGNAVENDVTWLFLKAIDHTHLPDPNVGFCVTEETSSDMLDYVAHLITSGHCQPQIWNSDAVTASLMNYGFDKSAACMFTPSTCVENTPIGCSGISITSPYINLLKIFLDSLKKSDNNSDFKGLVKNFETELEKYCDEAILQENLWQLERSRNTDDPVRASLLVHDCMEKGIGHENGGARYNQLEPNILGMQNVSESLNVIKKIVFEEKKITLDEFKKAIAANYEGYEALHSYIVNKVKHFGTGDQEAIDIQKIVADIVLNTFRPKKTFRGADVIPGAFSYREHEIQGSVTPASPDGRLNAMPLNDGSSPVQGYDNKGPTLSLASTVAWNPARFIGGTAINIKINKGVKDEKIVELIKGFIKTEGAQIQFNVVDTETLLKAQQEPDLYADLLVRIGGYSDFFVKLPKSLQDDVISRSANVI